MEISEKKKKSKFRDFWRDDELRKSQSIHPATDQCGQRLSLTHSNRRQARFRLRLEEAEILNSSSL